MRAEHYTQDTLRLSHALEGKGRLTDTDVAELETVDAVLDAPIPSLYLVSCDPVSPSQPATPASLC